MKKFAFGLLITTISFILLVLCFLNAFIINPYSSYDDITGMLASLLGNDMLLPFVVSLIGLVCGLVICGYEAYRKDK